MTTTFILAPGEEFIQCPYNTAHQITNARLITHLDKCRKAYMKDLSAEGRQKCMKICRHNALHHVPSPELRFHEDRCVDAFSVVRHMAYHNSDEGTRRYEERRKQDSEWQEESRSSHSHSSSHSHHHSSSSRSHHSKRHSSSESSRIKVEETKPVTTTANEWGLEEEDWETECAGSTAGYDPEVKLKSEVVIYNPAGLTKSERKKFRTEVRQKAAEMSLKGEPVELPTASTFEVKPNITELRIKEEGRRSPPEPGEIDDEEEDGGRRNDSHSRSSTHDRHDKRNEDRHDKRNEDRHSQRKEDRHSQRKEDRHSQRNDDRHSRHNSHDDHRRPSSLSSSSRHHSSNHSKSSYSRSSNSWADRVERAKEDFYPDSDDFEGYDPYM